jgi:hypothetical protein
MNLEAGPGAAPRRQLRVEVANDGDSLRADAAGQRLNPRQGPLVRSVSRLQDDCDVTRPVDGERGWFAEPVLVSQGAPE